MTLVAVVVTGAIGVKIMMRRPKQLGVQHGRLLDCPSSPNCVSSFADADSGRRVDPLPTSGDVGAAVLRVRRVLEAMPRTRIVTAGDDYLHAECRTRLRFIDDLEVLASADGSVLHIRSASRVGYSDLGVNRKRVAMIRTAYDEP